MHPLLSKLTIPIVTICLCFVAVSAHAETATSSVMNPPLIEVEGHVEFHETVEELEKEADIVAVVQPTDAFMQRKHHVSYHIKTKQQHMLESFYTEAPVNVKRILMAKNKEEEKKKELVINERVSLFEDADGIVKKIRFADYHELQKDQLYILYLKKNEDNTYSVLNLDNGKFLIHPSSSIDSWIVRDNPIHEQLEQETFARFQKELFQR